MFTRVLIDHPSIKLWSASSQLRRVYAAIFTTLRSEVLLIDNHGSSMDLEFSQILQLIVKRLALKGWACLRMIYQFVSNIGQRKLRMGQSCYCAYNSSPM